MSEEQGSFQRVGNVLDESISASSPGFTVQEAAVLLATSEQAIQGREKRRTLRPIPGTTPKRYPRDKLLGEHCALVEEHSGKLDRLRRAATKFNVGLPSSPPETSEVTEPPPSAETGSTGMDQRDESAAKAWLELVLYERGQRVSAERRLQSEEVGRAVAEAKIDGLESALRRVNQLVDDLTTAIRRQAVDPDLDLDRPAN